MQKIQKKITNPMTVIAIFAFISESSAAISLPFLDNSEREIYVWFLMSFPFYLLLLFFITLNFNYRSLYAPSDFDKDDSFLKVFEEPLNTGSTSRSNAGEKSLDEDEKLPAPTPWTEHNVLLPKPLGNLRTIDVRQMSSQSEFEHLLESVPRLTKQSAKVIIFLTDPVSDALLRRMAFSVQKQAKKSSGVPLVIAYNVCTQATTVLKGV
ncbi:hypothetical protein ACIOZM_24980 [Pseudomonas sp. NPDC087346]|uniref:hypothetical protein n=1 Tax=Pseudomonas sp. NPDC087346 TaxID=3364438 RepID=UPI00380E257F